MQLSTICGIILVTGVFVFEVTAKNCYLSSCLVDEVVKWTLPKQEVQQCTQLALGEHRSRCPCGKLSYVFDKPFVLAGNGELQEIITSLESEEALDFTEITCLQDGKIHGEEKDVFECKSSSQLSGFLTPTSATRSSITTSVTTFQSSTVAQGSCVDRCGLQYMTNSSCQCDFVCPKFDDCCGDFNYYCGRNDTCFGRCGLGFRESFTCQCNFACTKYNDCCGDYNHTCHRNGSCFGKCGLAYNEDHTCHCNFACTKYKDCCSDYNHTCVKEEENTRITAGFCSRYGCFDYDRTQPCQCNPYCHAYNSCCPDFEAHGCNTCRQMGGCISYDKKLPCQCNAECMKYNDCCSDFTSLCSRNVPSDYELTVTSCVGRCDAPIDEVDFTCQCNAACTRYGDCCGDYAQTCRNSCYGRCGAKYSGEEVCQCDDDCGKRNECCDDYDAFCHPRENLGNLLPI